MQEHNAEEIMQLRAQVEAVRQRLADLALRVSGDEPSFHFATRSIEALESVETGLRNTHFAWTHAEPR